MANKGWTGERLERFVLSEVTVEHLHRYSAVLSLIRDKVVLDIACGEGYGSNLMADYAREVVGVDISAGVISEASQKYCRQNLKFIAGKVEAIPLPDNSVDAIVSFETLEHHAKHHEMFREIKRVLKKDGFMVMSTPDRRVIDTWEGHRNIYHVKELYTEEFKSLVESYFSHVNYYRQKIVVGSLIVPDGGLPDFQSFAGSFEHIHACDGLLNALFNICIASNTALLSFPASFFDGREIIEESYKRSLIETRYYKYGYYMTHPIAGIKKIISKIY